MEDWGEQEKKPFCEQKMGGTSQIVIWRKIRTSKAESLYKQFVQCLLNYKQMSEQMAKLMSEQMSMLMSKLMSKLMFKTMSELMSMTMSKLMSELM